MVDKEKKDNKKKHETSENKFYAKVLLLFDLKPFGLSLKLVFEHENLNLMFLSTKLSVGSRFEFSRIPKQ